MMSDITRRRILTIGATASVGSIAGCTSGDPTEGCNLLDADVERQATRVGVAIEIKNNNFGATSCPVHATLFRNGEPIETMCTEVSATGNSPGRETQWFDMEDVVRESDQYGVDARIDAACESTIGGDDQ